MVQNPPDYRHDTVLPLPSEVRADAWAVDAACSGNPGPMEYQGIDLATGQRVFHFGPIHGTNNIGEFLAIVHALALMKQHGLHDKTIYSDSYNAILWVSKKKCKTNPFLWWAAAVESELPSPACSLQNSPGSASTEDTTLRNSMPSSMNFAR